MAKTATKDNTPAATTTPEKRKSGIFGMLDKIDRAKTDDGSIHVALTDIAPDPDQPRKDFSQERLNNLAASLKAHGVIQPLTLRRTGSVPPYMIVAGERRWRAAGIAGLAEVPAFIRDDLNADVERLAIVQMIENANRADLSDFEIAKRIQQLIDNSPDPTKWGLKGEIAEMLDRPRNDIPRLLALLDEEWLPLVNEGLIQHADALSRFRSCTPEQREALIAQAREDGTAITSGAIRSLKASAKAAAEQAPVVAVATPAGETSPAGGPSHNGGSGEVGQPEAGASAAADSPRIEANAGDGESGDDDGRANQAAAALGADGDGDAAPFVGSSNVLGSDNDEDEDQDNGERSHAGAGLSASGGEGGGSSSGAGSSTPRAKAVSVATTGEGIEVLLRYLVDKSSDRLEVRMPADLAIAVIEKLKGEVPEDPNAYGQRIKDLLTDKLQG